MVVGKDKDTSGTMQFSYDDDEVCAGDDEAPSAADGSVVVSVEQDVFSSSGLDLSVC